MYEIGVCNKIKGSITAERVWESFFASMETKAYEVKFLAQVKC